MVTTSEKEQQQNRASPPAGLSRWRVCVNQTPPPYACIHPIGCVSPSSAFLPLLSLFCLHLSSPTLPSERIVKEGTSVECKGIVCVRMNVPVQKAVASGQEKTRGDTGKKRWNGKMRKEEKESWR
nr:hypothetical protein L203_02184 [Cryptococcus depauperatus CBS 7841]